MNETETTSKKPLVLLILLVVHLQGAAAEVLEVFLPWSAHNAAKNLQVSGISVTLLYVYMLTEYSVNIPCSAVLLLVVQ